MTTTASEPSAAAKPEPRGAAPTTQRGDEAPMDEGDPRCGYPKKDGAPCRNRVPEPGKVCRVHQKAALLDRILAGRKSPPRSGSE
jgi:hypothetical protein